MPMVNESLIIQKEDRLIALIHPELEEAASMGFSNEDLEHIMEQNRKDLNAQMPSFAKISCIQIYENEFEKTAKKSIKRYLYQGAAS